MTVSFTKAELLGKASNNTKGWNIFDNNNNMLRINVQLRNKLTQFETLYSKLLLNKLSQQTRLIRRCLCSSWQLSILCTGYDVLYDGYGVCFAYRPVQHTLPLVCLASQSGICVGVLKKMSISSLIFSLSLSVYKSTRESTVKMAVVNLETTTAEK